MNRKFLLLFATLVLLPSLALAQLPDADGDGVPDVDDLCPAEDSSFFDADGDGCVDPLAHARHIEYWAPEDLPFEYFIDEDGAEFIATDGPAVPVDAEFDEVVAGIDIWSTVSNATLQANYLGKLAQNDADGTDGVNLVTFRDPDFLALFGNTVLAVGLTTSFTEPSVFQGQPVRPGQIVDADMLFNPARTFSASTSASAVEIRAVAVHEAGHLFGLNHSALPEATMFPALPAGFDATTLEIDDVMLATTSYPAAGAISTLTSVGGTVVDGATGLPIPGAAVFALIAGSDQKVASQYTLPDGSWRMTDLPSGDYDFFVAPLDGGADVNGMVPGFVNELVESTAQTVFVPDFYDTNESAGEDPNARTSVALLPGAPVTGLQIITNADTEAPFVQQVTPGDASIDFDAEGVVLVSFTEPIEFSTVLDPGVTQRFALERLDVAGPVGVGGQLVAIGSRDVLVFTPSQPLDFESQYRLTLEAGIEDAFGNATSAPFQSTFETEARPPLAVDTVNPVIAVPGATIVISGQGFDATGVTNNTVTLGGTPLTIQSVQRSTIVAEIPTGVPFGVQPLDVSTTTESVTGAAQIEIVNATDTARATPVTSVGLTGRPHQVTPLLDGNWSLVATEAGLEAVVTNGASASFGGLQLLPLPAGLDAVAPAAGGLRALGVSRDARILYGFDTDDGGDQASPLPGFLTTLFEIPTVLAPTGIAITPTGREAFVTTSEGVVQVWDLRPSGTTQPALLIGEIAVDANDQPFVGLKSDVAISVVGDLASVITTDALQIIDVASREVVSTVALDAEPAGIAHAPAGDVVYVTDVEGNVSAVPVTATAPSQVIDTDASLRGIAIGPTGGLAYAADRRDEEIVIFDLRAGEASFRTVLGSFDTGEDPIDAAVLPDATGVITVSEGSQTLDVFGIGFGPVLESSYPAFVSPGDIMAFGGSDFALSDSTSVGADQTDVDFDDTLVGPSSTVSKDLSFWLDRGWARIPPDFAGGPIRVVSDDIEIGRRSVPRPGRLVSNPGFATVFTDDELFQTRFGFSNNIGIQATDPLGGALSTNVSIHPRGDYALVDDGVDVSMIDLREESPTFLQIFAQFPLVGTADPLDDFFFDRAFTPDGKLLYTRSTKYINYFDADPESSTFGRFLGVVDFSPIDPNGDYEAFDSLGNMEIVPDGSALLVGVNLEEGFAYVPLRGAQANRGTDAFQTIGGFSNATIKFHPNGRWAYLCDGSSLDVLNLDPFSVNFLQVVDNLPSIAGETIEDVVVDKKGRGLWALTRFGGLSGQWKLWVVDFIDDPSDLSAAVGETVELSAVEDRVTLEMHPNGRRVAVNIPARRVAYLDVEPSFTLSGGNRTVFNGGIDITPLGLFSWDGKFTPDGKRYVGIEQTSTQVEVFDYSFGGIGFQILSDQNPIGAAGQTLPAPVRLRLVNEGNIGEPGVPVRVTVQSGGGTIENGLTERVFVSDENGDVDFSWTLGPNPGQNSVRIESGFSGLTFSAEAVVDPSTIPLELVEILPAGGATDVSATTVAQVRFSRPIDPASLGGNPIQLLDATTSTPVPVFVGLADNDRRVSLIPFDPLAYSTDYVVSVPESVQDLDGNLLGVGANSGFTTQAAPAPVLGGITPPAGTVGAPIVISGVGFDPAAGATTVTLNGQPVPATSVTVSSIQAVIPNGAVTGPLEIVVNGTSAGSEVLTVLVPVVVPVDEAEDSIDIGGPTQGLAVLPNGLKGYAVSTTTDQVIPVDLVALTNGTPIPVGSEPVSAASDVNGDFVYVANRGSNSLSVVDTATDTVVNTILLSGSPEQILASPNGDYMYVVTPDSQSVELIDVDATSASYNTATARFRVGASPTGGSVSPDGTVLFVFVDDGFVTIDLSPTAFGATARFRVGASPTGGSVSPDGTLLFLFTDTDEIVVVDINGAGFGTAVARFRVGASPTGGSVSPDGTILYVIVGETDEILAFSIDVSGEVSATEGLSRVDLQLLATIDGGDDPLWITFDPRDPTVAFVGASGDGAIRVFGRNNDVEPPTCEAFEVVFGTSWDPEPSLQEILDAEYGAGAVDAATDYEGFDCDDAEVPYWLDDTVDGWIIREVGGYANRNTLGWYAEDFSLPVIDGVDDGVIFEGGANVGDVRFVGLPEPTRFGLYLNPNGEEDAINAPEPELFFTNRSYNDVGPDGSGTIHAPDGGDPQALIYDVTALRGGIPTYLIAWEDVDSGAEITADYTSSSTDNDFNDLVVEIRASSPVSAIVSTVFAEPVVEGVRLGWELTGGVRVEEVVVERRGDGGDFEVVGRVKDAWEFVDSSLDEAGDYTYRLAVFVDGGYVTSNEIQVSYAPAVRETALRRAYPNPFNPQTTIEYALARAGDVELRIYNLAGRLVKTFDLGEQPVGVGSVLWTGRDDDDRPVSSGVYLVKLNTPDRTDALRVVLLK